MRLTPILVSAALVLILLTGCLTPPIAFETPDGFAQFEDDIPPRAISPEGVVLRVRTVENDPTQDLDFWSEALERNMTESGYMLLDSGEFDTGELDGVFFEWLAPLNDQDWVYLTGIAVTDDLIVIAEAAGPHAHYTGHRDSLLAALSRTAPLTPRPRLLPNGLPRALRLAL